jgi:hypothetical protein
MYVFFVMTPCVTTSQLYHNYVTIKTQLVYDKVLIFFIKSSNNFEHHGLRIHPFAIA